VPSDGHGEAPTPEAPRLGWLRWVFLLLACVSVLPLFFGEVPGVDYPMHLSYARFLRHYFEDASRFHELFGTRLWQPYWGFNGLVLALSTVFSVEAAGRIVLGFAILSVPVAVLRLAREEGLSPVLCLPVFALSYHYLFYWGFVPFMVGAGVALLGLRPVLRFARAPRARSLLFLHLISLAVLSCHVLAWCFWAAWALWIFATEGNRRPLFLLQASSLVVPAAILIGLWRASLEVWGNLSITMRNPLFESIEKKSDLFAQIFFPSVSSALSWLALALLVVLLFLAARGPRTKDERRRLLRFGGLAAFMFVGYWLLPQDLGGIHFLFQRFLLFTALFLLLCASSKLRHPRLFVVLSVALSIGVSAQHLVSFRKFGQELAGARHCLSRVEKQTRLLGLMVQRESAVVPFPLFLHADNYHAFWNLGRVATHPMEVLSAAPVYFRAPLDRSRVPPFFEWLPLLFDYPKMGVGMDYFLVHGPRTIATPAGRLDLDTLLFKQNLAEVKLICEADRWRLYENLRRRK
jgi:hypothetical protein